MTSRSEIWLALDLSSPVGTLSLHEAGAVLRLIVETELGDGYQHTERVLDCLDETLKAAGLGFSQLSRYVTGIGPGSFTGLRIALATLKAFSMARGLPLETASGSEARALAWSTLHGKSDALLVVTSVAMDRFVRTEFAPEKREIVSETVVTHLHPGSATVLLDGRIQPPDLDRAARAELFPLRSRYLAETLPAARTRQTHDTIEKWIAAAPQYFGARH